MALSDKHTECAQCGMVCAPNEYHPYAACLMFMACKDGPYVRANLAKVRKQDDALLQAALDALTCTGEADDPGHRCGHCDDYVDRNGQVRAALRARLDGKP